MKAATTLEKYFPLVIVDEDEWAQHVVKAMNEFSKAENKELIEICTKLIDANKRESVIETIEWTDELEDYLKTNKK